MAIWNGFVSLLETVLLTFYSWTGSPGIAIILFTIVARLVILPLTLKSLQSSRKMQELQPQIKELQRKYGKDPVKQQEEMSKLYREFKVNPVGGCLPMVFQLPIFFGVYSAVIGLTRGSAVGPAVSAMAAVAGQAGLNVAGIAQDIGSNRLSGGFLWLPNLGVSDPLYILPVLSIIFQLIVQLMAMPRVQDPQQKAMTQSMLVMPLIFGYIGFTFPSGAVLYWVVGSILSAVQQYVISGWGSLANYLKFLPTTSGLFPPSIPATATAGAGSVASSTDTGAEEAPKLSFWEALSSLTNQDEARNTVDDSIDSTEQEPRKVVRPSPSQMNPRRRRARR